MKTIRMTEDEYTQAKIEIELLKKQIKQLQAEKKKLTDKVRWFDYSKDKLKYEHVNGFAYQHFGKRHKDLTEDERREYHRLCQYQRRHKGNENENVQMQKLT